MCTDNFNLQPLFSPLYYNEDRNECPDSEVDIFITQCSFNGSINSGNDLENLLEDY